MKKLMAAVAIAALGFALNASAGELKEETKVKTRSDGTVVEKTTVKGKTSAGKKIKAEEKVTTKASGDMKIEEKVKTKNVKMEKTEIDTADKTKGHVKIKIKHGALAKLNVTYEYYQQGTEYIIKYKVKDKADKELVEELGLTPVQAKLIREGEHTITSTSPDTAGDVQANFRAIILKDIKRMAMQQASK